MERTESWSDRIDWHESDAGCGSGMAGADSPEARQAVRLEAVMVQLPDDRKIGARLGIGVASNENRVTLYIDGKYCGDMKLVRREVGTINGLVSEWMLRIFAPTPTGPKYVEVELSPSKYEWDRRHPAFQFHEYDWR